MKSWAVFFGILIFMVVVFGFASTWEPMAIEAAAPERLTMVAGWSAARESSYDSPLLAPAQKELVVREFIQAINEQDCLTITRLVAPHTAQYTFEDRVAICEDGKSSLSRMEPEAVATEGDMVWVRIRYPEWGATHVIRYEVRDGLIVSVRTME